MTDQPLDVLCAGIATWDTIFTGIDSDLMRLDGLLAEGYFASSGGDAVNAAVSMARLGMRTGICALLGTDSAGRLVSEALKEAGVHTEYLVSREDVHTASPVLLVDRTGERHIIRVPDNGNHFFTEQMISDEALKASPHLHLASANVMKRLDGKPLGRLFARAHAMGVTTSLDASYDRDGRWMENIEDALANCDLFFPSLQEASVYAGSSDLSSIRTFFHRFPLKVFGVKLGEKGAYVTDFEQEWLLPSLFHGVPVDTTGAGDAFLAAFVTGWRKGYDLPSCLNIGSAHACSVLKAPGANRSAGTWEDMEAVLRGNGIELRKEPSR